MSRRQRRRAVVVEKEAVKVSRWVRRGLGVGLGLLVLLVAGGWVGLRMWLHSDACRQLLGREAGRGLKAEAAFGPFRWEGTRVRTESFLAERGEKVDLVEGEGMEVELTLSKILDRVVRVERARVDRLVVEMDLTKEAPGGVTESSEGQGPKGSVKSHWYDGLVPKAAELGRLEIGESAVGVRFSGGRVGLEGVKWEVEAESGGAYRGRAVGGVVSLPWEHAPLMRLKEADLRYFERNVFLKRASFSVYERGSLELAGEVGMDGSYEMDGVLRGVGGDEVMPEDWAKRLEGNLEGDFRVAKAGKGKVMVDGEVRLRDAMLTTLPVLDTLAAYADTNRFRRVPLDRGEAKFRWYDGSLEVTDVVLSSHRLMRLEGGLKVDSEERLDGVFELGLMPGILGILPGAEAMVFQPGKDGWFWVKFRVFGTLDDPKEDLTQRLIEAAGMRLFEMLPETGERVLKFTGKALEDLPADVQGILEQPAAGKLIESGENVLGGAREVARGVGGLFDALRGKEDPPPRQEPREEESDR